jgi:hypothetical protein
MEVTAVGAGPFIKRFNTFQSCENIPTEWANLRMRLFLELKRSLSFVEGTGHCVSVHLLLFPQRSWKAI